VPKRFRFLAHRPRIVDLITDCDVILSSRFVARMKRFTYIHITAYDGVDMSIHSFERDVRVTHMPTTSHFFSFFGSFRILLFQSKFGTEITIFFTPRCSNGYEQWGVRVLIRICSQGFIVVLAQEMIWRLQIS